MAADLLKRNHAPITPDALGAIDAEAARVLKLNLAGRRLVDFKGPFGWHDAAVNTGRLAPIGGGKTPAVELTLRQVQPLVELRVPMKLSLAELDAIPRGAADPDLNPVVEAAERAAHAEDSAIFNGLESAGIKGIIPSSPHKPHQMPADVRQLPAAILAARETLREAGISGPYALALSTTIYAQVLAAAEDGYPLAKRLTQQVLDGPLVRAPAIEGGVLLSLRGGDYELHVGQDLSVGYAGHDQKTVEFFITESFTFRTLEPAAAVALLR